MKITLFDQSEVACPEAVAAAYEQCNNIIILQRDTHIYIYVYIRYLYIYVYTVIGVHKYYAYSIVEHSLQGIVIYVRNYMPKLHYHRI